MKYLIALLMTCGVAMAGDLGVLYNQAYRGTHGVAVSNLAAAALPKTFTNAAAVTTMKITGGTPAVGDIFVVTNASGAGTLQRGRTSFRATLPTKKAMSAFVVTDIGFGTVITNNGLTFDGTNLTLPAGRWMIGGSGAFANSAKHMQVLVKKNAAIIMYGTWVPGTSSQGYYTPVSVVCIDTSDGDDIYNISYRSSPTITTNANAAGMSFFWAEFLGE